MSSTGVAVSEEQRRRVRRSALLWALVAAAFYLGFIVMAILRGVK
jgi:predicted nucleic acid-binding Zn ribbon protein